MRCSVLIWKGFVSGTTRNLVNIEGILRKERYQKILNDNVATSGSRLIFQNFIFQENNDPKHFSKLCKNYLEKNNVIKL